MAQRSVTRRPRTTRADRRAAIEARLIAAIERLTSDGASFTTLSVEQIAAEAGVARSTFYAYFEDKPDLVRAVADHLFRIFLAETAPIWTTGDLDRAGLTQVLRTVLGLYRDRFAVLATLVETATYDPAISTLLHDTIEGLAGKVADHVRATAPPDQLRPLDLRPTVSALIWMIERTGYQLTGNATDEDLDRLADTLAGIVWHSLRPA